MCNFQIPYEIQTSRISNKQIFVDFNWKEVMCKDHFELPC